jgi:hydroxymethylglutaryl-CoA lyase
VDWFGHATPAWAHRTIARVAERVRITDVSPRDGLQNEPGAVPTRDKVGLVACLVRTGVDEVEVSSFVRADRVPQLGDAAEVFAGLAGAAEGGPMLSALVPNERGLDAALEVNEAAGRALISKASVFAAASETFSVRNTGATIAETYKRFRPVISRAHGAGLVVRGYVSCVVACPFEGAIAPAAVARVVASLRDLGVDEIDLGDTIGAATPDTIAAMLEAALSEWTARPGADATATGRGLVTLHLHDTFGRAAECVGRALEMGVRSFDGSVAGLGGCPYASTPGRRAPGNIDTLLLVRTIHGAGFATGVDLDALERAAGEARRVVAAARAGAKP